MFIISEDDVLRHPSYAVGCFSDRPYGRWQRLYDDGSIHTRCRMKRWVGRVAALVLLPAAAEVARPGVVSETVPAAVQGFMKAISALG